MFKGVSLFYNVALLFSLACPALVSAQQPCQEDQMLDTIRRLTDVGASDQRRITEWIQRQVDTVRDVNTEDAAILSLAEFRECFTHHYDHAQSSTAFKQRFAEMLAQIAAERLVEAGTNTTVARSLAWALVDRNRVETLPGLLAGLKSSDAATRYMCGKGLVFLMRAIEADGARFSRVVAALSAAGLVERDPVVLGRIYEALAYVGKVSDVFPVYVRILEKRLGTRRRVDMAPDQARLYALAFLGKQEVANAATAEQKAQLVSLLAVFFRLDAETYSQAELPSDQPERLERLLHDTEEVLATMVGSTGGEVRSQLSQGGRTARVAILGKVRKWVGDAPSGRSGSLNQAPWNVPIGAP